MKRIILALFSIIFLVYFDNYFAAPVLDKITSDLGASIESGGFLIAVYSMAAAFGAIALSPFSDRFGRKPMLQAVILGFAVFTIACGLSWNFVSLEVFRGICGLLGGVLVANTFAYTADYCLQHGKADDLQIQMGKVTAGIFGALVLGVPIGIYATAIGGWRGPFIAAGIVTFALYLPISQLPTIKPVSNGLRYWKSLAEGFKFMLIPELCVPLLIFFLQMLPTAFNTYAPNWIALEGYSLKVIAVIYVLTGLGSTVAAVRSGSVANAMGSARFLFLANCIMAACVLGMVMLPFNIFTVTGLFALYLACLSARMAQMQAFAMKQVGESERGRYSALISFCMQVGATVGVGLSAQALVSLKMSLLSGGIEMIGKATAGVLVVTAVACLLLRQNRRVTEAGRARLVTPAVDPADGTI